MDPRRVPLLIGRRSYNIRTSLDENTLRDVYGVLHEAVGETDPSMEQDERLFIAAMKLANDLVEMSDALARMTRIVQGVKSIWDLGRLETEKIEIMSDELDQLPSPTGPGLREF